MPKTVTSESKFFTGTVVFKDPLTWPDYMVLRTCMDQAEEIAKRTAGDETRLTAGMVGASDEMSNIMLPGICAAVQEWHLDHLPENVTPETFPASPRLMVAGLVTWIV